MTNPGYLSLYRSGQLAERIKAAWHMMALCELCPHRCRTDRARGASCPDSANGRGRCGMGELPKVSSWTLHPWEEPPISGSRGSGTIFFSGCTGSCRFCQNYPISQFGYGDVVTLERLAEMMLELQHRGAHNINFVTPTHFVPQILAALPHAIQAGLRLPLVYNSSGYERIATLRLLEGIVDLWLPDAKYADATTARRLSGFTDYVTHNQLTLKEMWRQVGDDLVLDRDGLAQRGLIVRHMVLPGGLAGTPEVLKWIAAELSPCVHVSLMDQYFPAHRAISDSTLGRKINDTEYETALQAFDDAGLERGWYQNTTSEL
jgi:putative pyruvate formate lyase activating enzyme